MNSRDGANRFELADSLNKDSSVEVRQIALQELVNKRGMLELARLRAAAPKSVLLTISWLVKRATDFESLTLNYYRTRPTEELLATITWGSLEGAPAYKVLATDRYESISSFIRSDLQDGFERIRQAWISDLQTKFGVDGAKGFVDSLKGERS